MVLRLAWLDTSVLGDQIRSHRGGQLLNLHHKLRGVTRVEELRRARVGGIARILDARRREYVLVWHELPLLGHVLQLIRAHSVGVKVVSFCCVGNQHETPVRGEVPRRGGDVKSIGLIARVASHMPRAHELAVLYNRHYGSAAGTVLLDP